MLSEESMDLDRQRVSKGERRNLITPSFDVDKESKISDESLVYGLGGVLLHFHGDAWRPVAYAF